MNNEFIEQTLKILKYTDISIRFPEIRNVTLEGDKRTMHMFLEGSSGGLRIKDNFILQVMIFFGLIDAHIDLHNPDMEGAGFLTKYKKLSAGNDYSIMIKEIFRLLRILRNSAIHSRTAISVDNNKIEAATDDSKLHLRIAGLELIYTFVMLLIKESNSSEEHKTSLLRTYFDDIRKAIILLQDPLGNNFADISKAPRLKRGVRYRVQNPVYKIDGVSQTLLIKKHVLKDSEAEYADYEYVLKIDNTSYLIPNEILDGSGKIGLEDIKEWTYN